jgi:hypothetical protein
VLAGEERGASCGARLLAVIVQEGNTLAADAVDVRGFVSHQTVGVVADIGDADIVAEDDQDVRLARGRRRLLWRLRLRDRERRARADRGGRERGAAE